MFIRNFAWFGISLLLVACGGNSAKVAKGGAQAAARNAQGIQQKMGTAKGTSFSGDYLATSIVKKVDGCGPDVQKELDLPGSNHQEESEATCKQTDGKFECDLDGEKASGYINDDGTFAIAASGEEESKLGKVTAATSCSGRFTSANEAEATCVGTARVKGHTCNMEGIFKMVRKQTGGKEEEQEGKAFLSFAYEGALGSGARNFAGQGLRVRSRNGESELAAKSGGERVVFRVSPEGDVKFGALLVAQDGRSMVLSEESEACSYQRGSGSEAGRTIHFDCDVSGTKLTGTAYVPEE